MADQSEEINSALYDLGEAVSRHSGRKFCAVYARHRNARGRSGAKTGLVGRVRLRLRGEGGDAAAHAYGAEDEVGEGADQERRIVERGHHVKFGDA